MSKVMFATNMQQEVLNSYSRITVISAEPGAGSTTALVLKAIHSCTSSSIDATFFVPTKTHAIVDGGVVSLIKELLKDEARYSAKSMIFTFKNGSKLKIVSCLDVPLESTLSLSRDLMLFDSNIPDDFIVHHLLRAYEAVVVDNICRIEKEDSWARKLNLVETNSQGGIKSFVSVIKHVKGFISDNHLFKGDAAKYKELVMQYVPENMRIEFIAHD